MSTKLPGHQLQQRRFERCERLERAAQRRHRWHCAEPVCQCVCWAVGDAATENMRRNWRTKIILRTEDLDTIDEAKKLAGRAMRFHSMDWNHSNLQRQLAAKPECPPTIWSHLAGATRSPLPVTWGTTVHSNLPTSINLISSTSVSFLKRRPAVKVLPDWQHPKQLTGALRIATWAR